MQFIRQMSSSDAQTAKNSKMLSSDEMALIQASKSNNVALMTLLVVRKNSYSNKIYFTFITMYIYIYRQMKNHVDVNCKNSVGGFTVSFFLYVNPLFKFLF